MHENPAIQRPGRCAEQVLPGFTGLFLEGQIIKRPTFFDCLLPITVGCADSGRTGTWEQMSARCHGKQIAMLEKELLENGHVRITFRISHYIWADSIALLGEFNDWDAHSHALHQTRDDGEWHISLVLQAGRAYRFRYLVDGKEWMDDDHADGYEPNPFGGFDSVVFT